MVVIIESGFGGDSCVCDISAIAGIELSVVVSVSTGKDGGTIAGIPTSTVVVSVKIDGDTTGSFNFIFISLTIDNKSLFVIFLISGIYDKGG